MLPGKQLTSSLIKIRHPFAFPIMPHIFSAAPQLIDLMTSLMLMSVQDRHKPR